MTPGQVFCVVLAGIIVIGVLAVVLMNRERK